MSLVNFFLPNAAPRVLFTCFKLFLPFAHGEETMRCIRRGVYHVYMCVRIFYITHFDPVSSRCSVRRVPSRVVSRTTQYGTLIFHRVHLTCATAVAAAAAAAARRPCPGGPGAICTYFTISRAVPPRETRARNFNLSSATGNNNNNNNR